MTGKSSRMAFGGMMTAVAVVIMCLGSLIPVNTYICPVLCILIARLVQDRCGAKLAWCYYMAVAVLSLLMAPDREAALVYTFLGFYPMIRPEFQKISISWLRAAVKVVFFSITGVVSMMLSIFVMGLDADADGGFWLIFVSVLLWDLLFLMTDRLLGMKWTGKRRSRY